MTELNELLVNVYFCNWIFICTVHTYTQVRYTYKYIFKLLKLYLFYFNYEDIIFILISWLSLELMKIETINEIGIKKPLRKFHCMFIIPWNCTIFWNHLANTELCLWGGPVICSTIVKKIDILINIRLFKIWKRKT